MRTDSSDFRRESNATDPDISVIIPAYNAAATLPIQLRALTRDDPYVKYEILVCDNGSSDQTASVVAEWATRAPVRLVDAAARRGPAAARNIGARFARGAKLAFCDADDMVGEGWIAGMCSALDSHEFVAGSFEFTELSEGTDMPGLWRSPTDRLSHKSYLPEFAIAGSGNMGIRRAVFEEVGGFFEPLRTAEDLDFCLRVQMKGHELVFVPDLVLHIRRRGGMAALCKQAFTYGAGEKRLLYRYSDIAAITQDKSANWAADPLRGHRGLITTLRRAISKVMRLRSPSDMAPVLWRWTWRMGWTLTGEDTSLPRVQWSGPERDVPIAPGSGSG